MQYNRVMINWYFAFYTLLGMISMSLSSLQLYAISIKIQKSPPDCNPLISNQCVSFRDYFFISLQALQIVFWIVGWSLFYRFMQRFYMKQRIWKEKYANSTGQDADFTHWLYKNCIEDY